MAFEKTPKQSGYSRADLCRILSITRKQLMLWEQNGRLTPLTNYSFADLLAVKQIRDSEKLTPEPQATKKALLAFQSELRRLERALIEKEKELTEWEQQLVEREMELDHDAGYDECCYCEEGTCNLHGEDECEGETLYDCDCDTQDAKNGCECFRCMKTREIGERVDKRYREIATEINKKVGKGDEIEWLEKLFTLKDRRRKK